MQTPTSIQSPGYAAGAVSAKPAQYVAPNSLKGEQLALRIRHIVLEQSKRAGVGHIGSSLSVADIFASLFGDVLRVPALGHPERDRFILSKGHAALGLYAAMHCRGWISEEQLFSFCGEDTFLGVHPEHNLPGIDYSAGSLGQGLSFAAGAALAARRQKSQRRVFALISDAECNEGSIWEAIMFAAHHKLSNLTAIIDLNGQQAFGYTKDVINLSPMAARWQAFGWDAVEVDGHNVEQITQTIESYDRSSDKPQVIVARTTFGKGVSFMENQIKWHYSPLNDAEYQQSMLELGVSL